MKKPEAQVAADKKALAETSARREKQIQEFHGAELDNIQAIENLKAAITVLGKHHGGNLRDAFPKRLRGCIHSECLQQEGPSMPAGWSNDDMVGVKKALKSASVFMQAHQVTEYYPSYAAKRGEIMSILKNF